MNKKYYKYFLINIIIFCLFTINLQIFADEIVIRSDDWMPFNGEPESKNPGFFIEVLNNIYSKKRITINYKIMPWNRSLRMAEAGLIDAVIGATRNESKLLIFPKIALYTVPADGFFVIKSSKWKYSGLNSLKDVTLGIIIDYDYGKEITSYIDNKKNASRIIISRGNTPLKKNIRNLLLKRIDVVISSPPAFYWNLNKMGIKKNNVKKVGEIGSPEKIYIAFTPKKQSSKKYMKIFEKGMKKLKKTRIFNKYLIKYNLKN